MNNRYVALSLAALSLAGFCWSAQGASPQILHRFTNDLSGNSDGAFPKARLISDSKGNLYGTTYEGGTYGYGTVFQLTPPIPGGTEWTQTVLKSFCQEDSCIDGSYPTAGLTIDTQGNLYGTTSEGGLGGEGLVFKLKPPENGETAWTEEVAHNFCAVPGTSCTDGSNPNADLLWWQGALYGTAYEGGQGCEGIGCGVVFKLTYDNNNSPPWTYTVLHRFAGGDGAYPRGRLISDPQGNLYGTTYEGGTYGYGTVFQLTPPIPGGTEWTQTVLKSFCQEDSCIDGSYPRAGLAIDTQGNLYGTTSEGGLYDYGMVFKLKPPENGETAWTEEAAYNFCSQSGCNDGAYPYAGLIFGPQGALYGTTSEGGEWDFGTVFKLTYSNNNSPPWTYTVLYTFLGAGASDGAYPYAGVIAGPQGNLYGTTFEGGFSGGGGACAFDNGCGTVFKLTVTGLGKGQTALIGINAP